MANPTRQEVKRELSKCQSDKKWGDCYQCKMGRSYLGALSVLVAARNYLDSGTKRNQVRCLIKLKSAVKRFDEGGDEQKGEVRSK